MFQLSNIEYESLRSQIVALEKPSRGEYKKYMPYVFTEQGVAMLSGVLKSKRAVSVNITIMRTFVAMKKFLISDYTVKNRIDIIQMQLEKLKIDSKKNEDGIKSILELIERMIEGESGDESSIGFKV